MTALRTLYSPLRVLLAATADFNVGDELAGALGKMHPAGELTRVHTGDDLMGAYRSRPYDMVFVAQELPAANALLHDVFSLARTRESFVFGCLLANTDGQDIPAATRDCEFFYDVMTVPLDRGQLSAKLQAIQSFRQLWLGYTETARMQRTMLEQTGDGALLVDHHGHILQANRAAEKILGKPSIEIQGQVFSTLLAEHKDLEQLFLPLALPASYPGRLIFFRKAGRLDRQPPVPEVLMAPDVLTGLPTHLLMQDRLTKALQLAARYSRNIGILLVDLDGFAQVNSKYGYATGDAVLQVVAQRLQSTVRSVDTIAREDGGKFVAILQELTHPDDALQVASRIRAVCQTPIKFENTPEIALTVSIGVARFPEHGKTAADLMRRAETALRVAKQSGANQVYCYSPSAENSSDRALLETQLQTALDDNQLEIYYQPKLDLGSGAIVGAEALIRWNYHGELRYPDSFIPIAEEMGIIERISQWVIREAVRQIDAWAKEGYDFTIAVNVSPKEFTDELYHLVRAALNEFSVSPKMLEIEITESALADNPSDAARVMHDLCELGVKLSIDDFGTGYSSLARIKSFPLHVLKIDRSFILSIQKARLQDELILCPPEAEKDLAIIRAIVSIARNLDLDTVAEGVELPDQLEVLGALGVRGWQGYYAAKPMPAKNFLGWVEHWRTAENRQSAAKPNIQ